MSFFAIGLSYSFHGSSFQILKTWPFFFYLTRTTAIRTHCVWSIKPEQDRTNLILNFSFDKDLKSKENVDQRPIYVVRGWKETASKQRNFVDTCSHLLKEQVQNLTVLFLDKICHMTCNLWLKMIQSFLSFKMII